ncbi:MAG: monovalent cation/H(+) antiporter subunit G [Pararhizobium sp.]
MTIDLADVPIWAAIPAAMFLVLGAGLSLLGTLGLVRLHTFYDRIHAPTLATSWGAGGMVMASMIIFTAASARPVFHEILIGIFVTVTTPVTLMMLGRATLYRDRIENSPELPKSARHVPEPEDGAEEESKA